MISGLHSLSPFPILFEDNHLIAVEKPAGISTQGSSENTPNGGYGVEEEVKKFIKYRDQKQGNVFLHAIFRLDKPVSGIVVFAKSHKALSRMNMMQRNHAYIKEYTALIHYPLKTKDSPHKPLTLGILEDYLLHDAFHARVVASQRVHPEAKKAQLRIESIQVMPDLSLLNKTEIFSVKLALITGRYHQIRAQFSSRGWPIVGDEYYQGVLGVYKKNALYTTWCKDAIALHHTQLSFAHPVGENISQVSLTSVCPWHEMYNPDIF